MSAEAKDIITPQEVDSESDTEVAEIDDKIPSLFDVNNSITTLKTYFLYKNQINDTY
jgi:hypothetical protein